LTQDPKLSDINMVRRRGNVERGTKEEEYYLKNSRQAHLFAWDILGPAARTRWRKRYRTAVQ